MDPLESITFSFFHPRKFFVLCSVAARRRRNTELLERRPLAPTVTAANPGNLVVCSKRDLEIMSSTPRRLPPGHIGLPGGNEIRRTQKRINLLPRHRSVDLVPYWRPSTRGESANQKDCGGQCKYRNNALRMGQLHSDERDNRTAES